MQELMINDTAVWLNLNAKLQAKKNALRKSLKKKGILKREARNDYDNYSYFSEAQYKELFTELFSENLLEFNFTEVEYNTFEGAGKQPNGRRPKLKFILTDVETGFYETSIVTGEGLDKGDKAGYKAYTGALKYYLANTFMVPTGDNPEKESRDSEETEKETVKITPSQIKMIGELVRPEDVPAMLGYYKVESVDELNVEQASEIIRRKKV